MKATWTKYYFENGVVIECRKLDANEKRDAINLTELFGKGKEPQTDEEVIAIIKEKQKFFKA